MCIKFCMTVWHKDIVTCWTHRDLEGPFFSIFKLLFTGKWTAQVFLSKLHSWGKLCLVISVGDTQAQSARTNNYCTEGRVVLMKPPHILTLLNPKVIEWGLFHIMYLYFVSIILYLSLYRHLFFLLQHYLLQKPCSVSKEELNPPPLASRTCISPSALRWKHQRQTVDGIGKKATCDVRSDNLFWFGKWLYYVILVQIFPFIHLSAGDQKAFHMLDTG